MNVLAIAVHPDDETLGCGATLLKHARENTELHWLIVTATSAPVFDAKAGAQQAEQVEAVRVAYPFASLTWLKLPATRLETLPLDELIRPIRAAVERLRPDTVYLPNRSDAHSDHRVAFQAASAVLKSFYLRPLGVRRVLMCEVPSETDAAQPLAEAAFLPQLTVDVTASLRRKLEILSLYHSEMQPGFLPRSLGAVEALARVRGAAIGVEFAEAYMLLREVG